MNGHRELGPLMWGGPASGATVFPDAHHWQVGHIAIRVGHGESGLIPLLNPILDTSHTRNRRTSPPNSACFPGTRKGVLKKIQSWVDSSVLLNKPHTMWVYGYAGCGKSAIAQEIADYFARKGRLAASFFFFRGAGDRSRIARFAHTLASQIAAAIPATAPLIEAAVKVNPGLLTGASSFTAQLQCLVYGPIEAVAWKDKVASLRRGALLIVLDGLDECEDREEIAVFVEHMLDFFDKKPRFPLRFLITSRVEDHIHRRLNSSKQVKLLNLVDHTSDADISAALDVVIAGEKRSRLLACAVAWPSLEDKFKLVKHIGGSFILMMTIVKLLFDPCIDDGLTPITRLPLILGASPDFDGLYAAVLQRSHHLPHFFEILSTVALTQQSLSVAQMADLLCIQAVDVVRVLVPLHAIIQVPGDDRTPVTLWHTSLRDFLCSETRSGHLFAPPIHHGHLSYRWISLTASTPRPISATCECYRQLAKYHFEKFLELFKDDVTALKEELNSIITHLWETFPTEFHDIGAIYFRLDRPFLDTLPRQALPQTIASLIGDLCPRVGHPWPLINDILGTIMSTASEAALFSHVMQSCPQLLPPRHHLHMVLLGIRFLVKSRPSDGALALHARSCREDWATEYMFACWPKHLALAIQIDPQHPAFDPHTPIGIPIEEEEKGRAGYLCPRRVFDLAKRHLDFAIQTVETFVGPEADTSPNSWGWDDRDVIFKKSGQRSLTVFDVLNGFRSLRLCFEATCEHSKIGIPQRCRRVYVY